MTVGKMQHREQFWLERKHGAAGHIVSTGKADVYPLTTRQPSMSLLTIALRPRTLKSGIHLIMEYVFTLSLKVSQYLNNFDAIQKLKVSAKN